MKERIVIMPTPRKYDNETRARAVRMCQDRISEGTLSKAAVYREVGGLLDINPETLRSWADQDLATHQAQTPGEVSKEEIARLRRENSQLRRANEILKTASVDSTGQRNSVSSLSAGVSKFSVFLGREFNRAATLLRSSWVRSFILTPLGKY